MHNSILSAYQFALLMGTLLFLEAISLYGENTFALLKTNVCSLKRPTPSFRRPLWVDNSLLGVLHHLLHRHNARSCCEYLQQNCKHSFKLYQKIRHQIRMNVPHHPVFRYGLTPWGLFAMITRSSGMLVGEVLTVNLFC